MLGHFAHSAGSKHVLEEELASVGLSRRTFHYQI